MRWTDAPWRDSRPAHELRRLVCAACKRTVDDVPAALLHEHVRHDGAQTCWPVDGTRRA